MKHPVNEDDIDPEVLDATWLASLSDEDEEVSLVADETLSDDEVSDIVAGNEAEL